MDVLERSGPRPSLRVAAASSTGVAPASLPTLTGHLAVFNQWTEIDSAFEGRFLERIAPGAFARTFREDCAGIKVTFQHGKDPYLGDKVLGPILTLEEDAIGGRYDVPLLDTACNAELIPGLEARLYGSSFRFRVRGEEFNRAAKRSDYNPEALPERTITDAQVYEFGPVVFPAYAAATAGLRNASVSDLRELIGELDAFLGAA